MKPVRKPEDVHPLGEDLSPSEAFPTPRTLDTFCGAVEVEWNEDGAAGLHGGLVYFIEFLNRSRLWERFVQECPLEYVSPNAPSKDKVLGTILFNVLSGHLRYSHINGIRSAWTLGNPPFTCVRQLEWPKKLKRRFPKST